MLDSQNDDLLFEYLNKIEDFLTADEKRRETFKNYTKQFSDLKCSFLPITTTNKLTIHIDGFNNEQIYQQLKSLNEKRLKTFMNYIVKNNKTKMKPTFAEFIKKSEENDINQQKIIIDTLPVVEQLQADRDEEEEEENEKQTKTVKQIKKKKSVTFFDSSAMSKFLEEQDIEEMVSVNPTKKNEPRMTVIKTTMRTLKMMIFCYYPIMKKEKRMTIFLIHQLMAVVIENKRKKRNRRSLRKERMLLMTTTMVKKLKARILPYDKQMELMRLIIWIKNQNLKYDKYN